MPVTNTFARPFSEQVEFFRKKLNLPTERWDDIKQSAHDRGFMVAGAAKADLLDDLRKAVDKSIAEGKSLGWFRQNFDEIVKRRGWTGWTGEGSKAGRDWRTRIIYQTNMSTSYAAGRWRQLNDPDLLKVRPYKRYVHADGVRHPRPQHQSWNGITLPHDDPFWQTHFAPNGWMCHCYIVAASASDYETAQGAGRATRPDGWDTLDPKTGAPPGIDKGFGYAPGANTDTSLRQMVQDKLITYPPAITRALSADVNRYVNAHDSASDYATRVLADRSKIEPLWLGFVENSADVSAVAGRDVKGYLVLLPDEAPRHGAKAHGHDGGSQRPPTAADYALVWQVLAQADSLRAGELSATGLATVVALKKIGGEVYRCVFDVRPGKKNRSLSLLSLVIKR